MRSAGIYKSHDLLTYIHGLLTANLGQFSMVKIFVIGRFLALLMVASSYFARGFTSVRPAASAFMPRVHAWGWGWRSISRTS